MNNNRRVIAIDIDDVLSSQLDVLIEFSTEKLGRQFTKKDFMAPGQYWGYFIDVWGIGRGEGHSLFEEFLTDGYPLKQVIKEDVKDALRVLKKDYDLEIITSRGAGYEQVTKNWLDEQIPNIFKGVNFVHQWDIEGGKATKAVVCNEIGAEYIIDDNADHCNLAAEVGVKALLFGEFGWSIDKQIKSNVVRVNSWLEVLEYFQNEGK